MNKADGTFLANTCATVRVPITPKLAKIGEEKGTVRLCSDCSEKLHKVYHPTEE